VVCLVIEPTGRFQDFYGQSETLLLDCLPKTTALQILRHEFFALIKMFTFTPSFCMSGILQSRAGLATAKTVRNRFEFLETDLLENSFSDFSKRIYLKILFPRFQRLNESTPASKPGRKSTVSFYLKKKEFFSKPWLPFRRITLRVARLFLVQHTKTGKN
jgi:hypothetical protein